MDWTYFGDNDDHMVPEVQDAPRWMWVSGGDPSQIPWVGCTNAMASLEGGKKPTVPNRICQTEVLKAPDPECKDRTDGGAKALGYVCQNLGSEFQFKASATNAGDIHSRKRTQLAGTRTVEAGLLNNMLAGDASICVEHSVYEDESTAELSASCQFSLMNERPVGVDGLFECGHPVDKVDDVLEHPWENIDNLSSLEDVDNIFLDPLFQTDAPDVGSTSQAPNFLSGLPCTSLANVLQYEIPSMHVCVESLSTSNKISHQSSLEYQKKRPITALLNHALGNSGKDIKENDNSCTQTSHVASSLCGRAAGFTTVKLRVAGKNGSNCAESGPAKIEDKACLSSQVCTASVSQGESMTFVVSNETDGAHQKKLMEEEGRSMDAVVLHELEAVMMRLDLRTRICIRDALYRLARSSRQRHAVSEGGNTKIVSENSSNLVLGSKPPFLVGHPSFEGIHLIETQTNPIDRAIANLLFHKQSAQSSTSFGAKVPATSMVTLELQHQLDWQPLNILSSNLAVMSHTASVEAAQVTSETKNKIPRIDRRTNLTAPEKEDRGKAKMPKPPSTEITCSANSQKILSVPYYLPQVSSLQYGLEMPPLGLRPAKNQMIGISAELESKFKFTKNPYSSDMRCTGNLTTVIAEVPISSDQTHSPANKG
eukprot:Gb_13230 [translate_table: standard]